MVPYSHSHSHDDDDDDDGDEGDNPEGHVEEHEHNDHLQRPVSQNLYKKILKIMVFTLV